MLTRSELERSPRTAAMQPRSSSHAACGPRPRSSRRSSGATVLLAAALCSGCSARAADRPVADERLNVVLIVVDTLRADHLSLYGYEKLTSPHLDAFARNAVVFTNVTAQAPWTAPSLASLFSSLYPSAHGITHRFSSRRIPRLADAHETLPEVLARAGWATAGVVANPLVARETGMAQGFDSYRLIVRPRPPASELNRIAIGHLSADPRRPFFLYLHYMDVHGPYYAPEPFRSQFRPTGETERFGALAAGRCLELKQGSGKK